MLRRLFRNLANLRSPQADAIANILPEQLTDLDRVRLIYLALLGRPADPPALKAWRNKIIQNKYTTAMIVDALTNSPEYAFGSTGFFEVLHGARQAWASTLPAAGRILDIGGSSPDHPGGGLIELGYPHRPDFIHILDLPEDEQFHGRPKYSQANEHSFEGVTIRYHHGHAESIDEVADLNGLKFDLVFMGQAIEHVEPEGLPRMLKFVREHLSPNGRFIFDTPNRALTEILMHGDVLNADHKREYLPAEMETIVTEHGFRVQGRLGFAHMPRSLAECKFQAEEVTKLDPPDLLNDAPEESFLFALECAAD